MQTDRDGFSDFSANERVAEYDDSLEPQGDEGDIEPADLDGNPDDEGDE